MGLNAFFTFTYSVWAAWRSFGNGLHLWIVDFCIWLSHWHGFNDHQSVRPLFSHYFSRMGFSWPMLGLRMQDFEFDWCTHAPLVGRSLIEECKSPANASAVPGLKVWLTIWLSSWNLLSTCDYYSLLSKGLRERIILSILATVPGYHPCCWYH